MKKIAARKKYPHLVQAYIDGPRAKKIKMITEKTGVPKSTLIRRGIDLILEVSFQQLGISDKKACK